MRDVKREEAGLARARHEQTARAETEAVRAATHKAAEEKRLAEQAARDAVRTAERAAAEKRAIDRETEREVRRSAQQQARDAERFARAAAREERAALRERLREEREAARERERLLHEQSRLDNTVAGVAGLYAAHRAVHAARAVGERYAEYDSERRYQKVVTGLTDEQQRPLVDQAIHGSGNSRYNDVQWLAAQRNLAARGYNRDQVLGFTPVTAQLGQAFDLEKMEDGVKLLEGAMLGFKKDVSTEAAAKASAQRTADLEVKSSKISGMNAEDIEHLYARGAQAAKMAGLTEEQMLAFGGAAKKVNIGGDESATAFVALTKNLLQPTQGALTAMRAAGIDYSRYQKVGPVDEAGFANDVAAKFGVRLKSGVRAGLRRIFNDPDLMKDPARFTPAVARLLRRDLHGNDAKSLRSIAGEAGRYRQASVTGVDTQALLAAIMQGLAKNPGLAIALFGSKQAGRIASGLDADVFGKLLDELRFHSQGFATDVSNSRMAGFKAALLKFGNQVAILETSIGRAFDNNGEGGGGALTHVAEAATKTVAVLGDLNPRLLRAGSEAVLLAGAFGALKGVEFFKGGFGLGKAAGALDVSAVSLDASAKLLDEAAIKLGATGAARAAEGGAAAAAAEGGAVGAASKLKGLAGVAGKAVPALLAYEAGTGVIDQGLDLLPKGRNDAAARERIAENHDPFWHPWLTVGTLWAHLHGRETPEEIAARKAREAPKAPPKVPSEGAAEAVTPLDGARAEGGPVSRGKTYLVGERGPEIFTAGASGQVTSHERLVAALRGPDTPDVQTVLSRAGYQPAEGGETAKAVRAMGFELSGSVDGVARAVDRLDARDKAMRDAVDAGGGGGSGTGFGGAGGGRRGFMAHMGGGPGGGFAGTGGVGHAASGALAKNAAPMMEAMQKQLVADGVKPENVKAAAAALMGNVVQESGGDPNKVHDHGTGYGIYGARLGRRDAMLAWLAKNGYAKNDAVGQARYMAHEAMTGADYAPVASALRGATQGNLGSVTDIVAKRFERPAERYANYAGRRDNAARAFGGDIGGAGADSPGGIGGGPAIGASKAVDIARGMIGMNDTAAGQALHRYMHGGAWCADFVNGTLAKAGGRGTENALAASFFKWGHEVDPRAAKSGDVMVSGHHVGFAEGPAQLHNGRMMVPMISGNHGHRVGESWEPVGKYQIRHGDDPSEMMARRDDPLGLRRREAARATEGRPGDANTVSADLNHAKPAEGRPAGDLHDGLSALHGRTIRPEVDLTGIHEAQAAVDRLHGSLDRVHTASARNRERGQGAARIAGLGSKLRGGFTHSGSQIG